MMKELKIHFTFDLTCPFCYLAYSRLSNALKVIRSRQRNVSIQMHFHPYILNSQLRTEEPLLPYLQQKMSPKTPDGRQRYRYLSLLSNYFGQDGSSPVSFSEDSTIGPTFECHRLIQYIQSISEQETVAAAAAADGERILSGVNVNKLGAPALLSPPLPTTPSDTDEGGVLLPPSPMPFSMLPYLPSPLSLHHPTNSRTYSDSSASISSSISTTSTSSTSATTPSPPLSPIPPITTTQLPPNITESLVAQLFQSHYSSPLNAHAPGSASNLKAVMEAVGVPESVKERFLKSRSLWRVETQRAIDSTRKSMEEKESVPLVRLCGDDHEEGTVLAGLKRMEDYVVSLEGLIRECQQ